MRVKDEDKKRAIFEATVELLNEIGFANLSMSEIAKKAGVSSSTIYVYYENKEDMLKKVYLDVIKELSAALARNIEPAAPVRQVMGQIIRNILDFAFEQTPYFFFIEQFSNAPVLYESCTTDALFMLRHVFETVERGQREGIIKEGDPFLLLSFCYYGSTQIAKNKLKRKQELTDAEAREVMRICWDAIAADGRAD